ncbi:16S rRNA (cytidine1402-2'-O)-methyltransferase [Natranaerovirga hydrolytica]|uniref:Ribosomal RNA small subunit methyltransferase I n=1 Tax=Natranaerovirga hydrolytica TaxID=680378 RepID=A0A4R1N8Z7_9FIRM|nr:16S rRNA (cytidine(1402)-2'-O)-methyltransferase [Natranaerovirga hydrolytica]TCL00041.1 16S rRNA (cytidine1402-2'-O)-methyltransferase [Natranaerovirga hydrolytica]
MKGKLILCATPIGNLEDITLRTLNTLKEVDCIAAEDTRHTQKLLNAYHIKKPLTSYHEHNKIDKAKVIIEKIKEGNTIALVSDAGTPGISDPGEELVKLCYKENIEVTALPGAVAGIMALILSGLSTRRFAFEGFLPTHKKEKEYILKQLNEEVRTIILYEAPHRLKKTLQELKEALGNRKITICKELTKKFETIMPIDIERAILFYEKEEPRGEYVLVIEGKTIDYKIEEDQDQWKALTIEEHMTYYEKENISKKEAMKLVAKDRGVGKRDIYKALLKEE